MGRPAPAFYGGVMATTTTTTPDDITPALEATPQPAPVAAPVVANTFSITSLVLGILGIGLGQPLLGIGAIVLGFVARPREPQALTTSTWGIVLGFIATFGGLLLGLVGLVVFAPLWIGGTIGGWNF